MIGLFYTIYPSISLHHPAIPACHPRLPSISPPISISKYSLNYHQFSHIQLAINLFIYLSIISVLTMKKNASCTSYSEFRKKNLVKQSETDGNLNILEIDQLSKQLQAITVKRTIQRKFLNTNNIIEEEDEEETIQSGQKKGKLSSEAKLGRILNNKTTKGINISNKKTVEPPKLNKTCDATRSARYLKQGLVNQKQRISFPAKITTNKQPILLNKRLSLNQGGKTKRKQTLPGTEASTSRQIEELSNELQVARALEKISDIQRRIKNGNLTGKTINGVNSKLDEVLQLLKKHQS